MYQSRVMRPDSLYCGKRRKISKSRRDLDLGPAMPNIELVADIFIYYDVAKFRVHRSITFELSRKNTKTWKHGNTETRKHGITDSDEFSIATIKITLKRQYFRQNLHQYDKYKSILQTHCFTAILSLIAYR